MANQPKKYKKFVATAATATLVASAIVPVASADTIKFSDVSDSNEFAPYIYDLAEQGVMTGAAGKFNPSGEVTRNAAVKTLGKWLVNVHEYEIPADYKTKERFTDIPVTYKDEELLKYAALVKDLGVFSGAAGKLNPTGTLTREQMAKVVVEAYSVVENRKVVDLVKDFESSLTDIDKVAKDLVDYVKVFEKYEVTTVKTFNPKGKVQRQHFAKFLSLAINDEELKTDTKEKAPVIDPDKEPGQPEPPINYAAIEKEITEAVLAIRTVEVTTANVAEVKAQLDAINAKIVKAEAVVAAATDLTDAEKATYKAKFDLAKTILASVQAKVDALLPGSVAEEVATVEAAVAALPATVTEASADAAQVKVDAVKTAVAALEKAIAEAKNLPAAEKAAAEKAVADAKAAAAKTQAAIDAALAKVNVESVKATNATSVEVTFGKDQKLTEADLKDQVLKITDAEGKVVEATYRTSSLADGKATFDLPLNEKLVDAAKYTAEFKGAKAEFVAKVTTAYAKKFSAVTTAVPATGTTLATKSVFFEAVDQYGEAIAVTSKANLKVTVAYNGLPLVNEYSVDVTNGKLEVKIDESKRTLTKDGKLNIKVETYDKAVSSSDAKLIETSTASYTIIEGSKVVATTIEPIKATYEKTVGDSQKVGAPATEVLPNNEINLKAEVKDQYGNPVAAAAVRWVVTEGKDLISGNLEDGTYDTTADTVSFKAVKPGKVTIEAYNVVNGAKQTYTVEIAASKLAGITVDTTSTVKQADGTTALVNATPYNKEEAIVAVLDANPSSALLKAEDVKFEVATATKDVKKEDLTVKAEKITVGTGTNAKSYIVVKATSAKKATFKVTPYVGESLEKSTIKGSEITVDSKENPTVAKIEVEEVKANELQKGKELVKAVKFFNKHGEQITVEADALTALGTSSLGIKKYAADSDGKQAGEASKTNLVAFLGFTAPAAGSYTATLVTGPVSTSITLSAVEAGKVQTLTLGGGTNVSVIAADSYDAKDKTDNIAVVDGKAYTLISVSAKDNYGVDVALATADLAIVKDPKVEVNYFQDLEGKEATGKNVKYIGIHATGTTTVPTEFKVDLANGVAKVDGFVAPAKQVTVTAARKADKATVAPTTVNLALGGTATVKVNVVDQYGKPFNLSKVADIKITAPGFTIDGEKQSTDAKEQAIVGQYEFKATATETGAKTIEVAVADITAKSTVNVNVATASELVKSLVLSGKDLKDGVAVNKLKSTGDTTTISVVGKDASGGEVNVNPVDVIWTSSNPALATVSNGKVTVSSTLVTKDEQVTITADVFGVKQSVTFTISKDAPVLKAGTFAVVNADKIDADSKTEGLQVYLDNDAKATDGEKDGAIELSFTGVDQYGDVLSNLDVTAISYNSTIASVQKLTGDKLKITSVKAGETTIRVTVGANEILIPVKVTEDAVKAIPGVIALKHIDYLANTIGARVAGSAKEVEAANYIQKQLEATGLKAEVRNFSYVRSGRTNNSANVVAYKKGESTKEIIVGAHYDSVSAGKGVDDNASGVGVMLEIAEKLKDVVTPYSIKFIAFGAEEVGLRGSLHYVNEMTQAEKDNTVLMVNLDSLVAGDVMYAYGSAGNKGFARDLALDIAKRKNLNVITNPGHNPRYPAGTQIPNASDNEYFDRAGIPYLYFEATNWDLGAKDGYTQTVKEGSIWHTPKDSLEYIENAFPGRIATRLNTFTVLLKDVLTTLDSTHIR